MLDFGDVEDVAVEGVKGVEAVSFRVVESAEECRVLRGDKGDFWGSFCEDVCKGITPILLTSISILSKRTPRPFK